MSDVVKNMNGTVWVFAALLIGIVIVQAFLFLRLALRFNKEHNLVTKEELKDAVKVGTLSTFGPSLSNIVVALGLISMVGSGLTFMRCGVIGAPSFEMWVASFGAQFVGVEFNTPEFTEAVMTFLLYFLPLASLGYFVVAIVMFKPMDMAVQKSKESESGQKLSFLPYLSNAAMFGLLTFMIVDYLGSAASITAIICAMAVYFGISAYIKKTNKYSLYSFALTFAMIAGMVGGEVCTLLIG